MAPGRGAAPLLEKLIRSAMANATDRAKQEKADVDVDGLVISEVVVGQGPTLKRWRPRALGRATPILRRTAHITVVRREGEGGRAPRERVEEKRPERRRFLRRRGPARARAAR